MLEKVWILDFQRKLIELQHFEKKAKTHFIKCIVRKMYQNEERDSLTFSDSELIDIWSHLYLSDKLRLSLVSKQLNRRIDYLLKSEKKLEITAITFKSVV
jgi:hypothetical protein